MKIKKIILKVDELTTFSEKNLVVYDNLGSKKINIFFMPNTSGKSLIFNGLEHLFSFLNKSNDKFIKDTNKDLTLEIEFNINSIDYTYIATYANNYKILLNGDEIKNFDEILEGYIGIEGKKLEYYGSKKSSLYGINRFNFLDFDGIKDNESSNEIPFINSRYDGMSRKFILSYILGADIDNQFFKVITEFEFKNDFINKYKGKFEKYINNLDQLSITGDNLEKLFFSLENNRIIYGDISIAIKELKLLKEEYIVVFKVKTAEDILFLENEIKYLTDKKVEIKENITKIRTSIKGGELLENKILLKKYDEVFKKKDLINFEKYKKYKEDLIKIDKLEIENYILKNVEPFIKEYKLFLDDLYNIFTIKAIKSKLIGKGIPEKGSIIFKENKLTVEALFKTSKGMRETIRILTFIGLHIFSNVNKMKCLDYSFYDSFIENIDSQYRNILFDSIFEFISKNKYELPKMFFFITDIEVDGEKNSITKLRDKYGKYINLIDSSGIK